MIYDTYDSKKAIFGFEKRLQGLKPGKNVQVDIAFLIHKIVVSPAFPPWAVKSLQKAVDAAFSPATPIKVELSVLLDEPEAASP